MLADTLPTKSSRSLFVFILLGLLLMGAMTVSAQETLPIPIDAGQTQVGELSAATPLLRYVLTIDTPEIIRIQVIAISEGLIPTFRIVDASGVVVQNSLNPESTNIVEAVVPFTGIGAYVIEVQGGNNSVGQFVLALQQGTPLPPPLPLLAGQAVEGTVDDRIPLETYLFTGDATRLMLLFVRAALPEAAPSVVLRDADTGVPVAISGAGVAAVTYRIPAGILNYQVDVTFSGGAEAQEYVICVGYETGAPTCPADLSPAVATPTLIPTEVLQPTLPATLLPPLPVTGPCIIASATGGAVNVRSGPGLNFNVITQLSGTATAPVLGRLPDNSWLQINISGFIGWISSTVTRTGGQCGLVPVVVPTPTHTPTFTATATATPTATTDGAATSTATATATATTESTATATATATETETEPEPVATLNFSLPPIYGSTALTSVFSPDPFSVGVTAGGPANVAYLGGGCAGYTTSAPSFSVNYTSGAAPTLRFYFVGAADTTMIINSPGGSYFCVDDSFGTLNPTIDFNTPASGRYDVWIGTFNPGESVGGTLYVTENTDNRP